MLNRLAHRAAQPPLQAHLADGTASLAAHPVLRECIRWDTFAATDSGLNLECGPGFSVLA
jgi:hypothetical protein